MKSRALIILCALLIAGTADAAVIQFQFGTTDSDPFVGGSGSFEISDVYNPTGRYDISGLTGSFGALSNPPFGFDLIPIGSGFIVAKDLASVTDFDIPLGADVAFVTSQVGRLFRVDGKDMLEGFFPDATVSLEFTGMLPQPPGSLAVPEPASWAMIVAGFAMIGSALRRRPKVRLSFG